MTNVAAGFRNFTKVTLLWLTLAAVAASLYGALLASQPGPRRLQIAENLPVAAPVVSAALDTRAN